MDHFRLALVGLGRAGQFHLQSIRQLAQLELGYVIDADQGLAAQTATAHGCPGSNDFSLALSDPTLHGVIIATPTGAHYSQILQALEAGKAVFTEKPLGETLKQIRECYALAEKVERPLMVGFNRRFDPTFSSLAAQVVAGSIGRPMLVRITSRDSPLPTLEYLKTSHGIFHDCIVHDLDMLRFITREDPGEVYAVGSNFVPEIQAINDLDNVLVTLKYKSGLLATIDVNRLATYGYDQRIEAFGDKGMLQAENRSAASTVLSNAEGVGRPKIEHSFPSRYREAYVEELRAFARTLQLPSQCPITEQDVCTSHQLCDAAQQSYREQKPIKIELPMQ